MINKNNPTSGFVDYINHIKPYHTKILETSVEFVCSELVSIGMFDDDPRSHPIYRDRSIPTDRSTVRLSEHISFEYQ